MKVWAKTEEFSEGKFLVTRRDGTTPDWPHFVMGARDKFVPAGLRAYAAAARAGALDPEYCDSVSGLALDFERYRAATGDGDPDARPHRKDLPLAIGMMRHQLCVADIAASLERIELLAAERGADALPAIQAIARILLDGRKPRPEWRHLRRGSEYTLLCTGTAQAATRPIQDGDRVEIYLAPDKSVWVRRSEEFHDGRFASIAEESGR